MKIEICIIQETSKEGNKSTRLEIGNNISLPLTFSIAHTIVSNLQLDVQETFNNTDGSVTELLY